MKYNIKSLSIIVMFSILIIIFSPFPINWYVKNLQNAMNDVDSSDLWGYAAAILTAIVAGAFIVFQVNYEERQQHKRFLFSSRPDIDISFERADISNEEGYIFCEDWYVNSLKKDNKFQRLKEIYLDLDTIPPSFKIESFNNSATNIIFHYNFTTSKSKKRTQNLKVGNVREGEAKYFITFQMMQHATSERSLMNRDETLNNNVEYLPDNFYSNNIYITFRTAAHEKGLIIYNIKENIEQDPNYKIEDSIDQNYKVYFEHDSNFPTELYDDSGHFLNPYKSKKGRLVKLNSRLLIKDKEIIDFDPNDFR